MKSLNQNVLGIINAAVSSCDLISNSSLPDVIRDEARALCVHLGNLTLHDIDSVQIEIPNSNASFEQ